MRFEFSEFGEKFSHESGILRLMNDLGTAMHQEKKPIMLGGGNPAVIPEITALYRNRMADILKNDDEFDKMIGYYDTPKGKDEFLQSICSYFNEQLNIPVALENIAVTNGSQNTFFYLFNILAGHMPDGTFRKILLPLSPEYIGYADQGIYHDFFRSQKPLIEFTGSHTFKYHVDFENLTIDQQTAAICVSRPTNPSGNVLSDNEIQRLHSLAVQNGIPMIIDNAYGLPFPGVIFKDTKLFWDESVILSMSLSKIGLPSTRTGIIIAAKEIIRKITAVNAIVSLANSTLGQVIASPLIRSGELARMGQNIVKPFYQNKSDRAVKLFHDYLDDVPGWYLHQNEGSFFLWLWLPDFPMNSFELYNELLKDNVIVVPGNYFFESLTEEWNHKNECIRINIGMDDTMVQDGIKIICRMIRKIKEKAVTH